MDNQDGVPNTARGKMWPRPKMAESAFISEALEDLILDTHTNTHSAPRGREEVRHRLSHSDTETMLWYVCSPGKRRKLDSWD